MLPRSTLRTLAFGAHLLAGAAGIAAWPVATHAALSVTVTGSQTGATVRPGATRSDVFVVQLTNNDILSDATLTSITFTNLTSGPGTPAQRDQDWQVLELWEDKRIIIEPLEGAPLAAIQVPPQEPGTGPTATTTFSGGIARFSGFAIDLPAGGTTTLHIRGGASLTARDSDVLDLYLPNTQALTIPDALSIGGSFPIHPAGNFPVDGMSSFQIGLTTVGTPTLPVGSTRNLAFDLRLPANGYQTDVLQRLDVQNLGTARAADEIAAMEAWVDDGDGTFKPSGDTRLGTLVFTGDRWQLTGLSVPMPLTGLRVFVSVDVAELAEDGRTVRLSLPTLPDVGVGMASTNDGPVDKAVANPTAQTIAVVDRITLAAKPADPGTVVPGETGVVLFDLVATNTYSVDKQLTALTVTNATSGPGSVAERDGEVQALVLREDADDDGLLDPGVDPVLATAFFLDGRASFAGFSWHLPQGKTRQLFVTGDVSLAGAADGDVLGASIAGAGDLAFADPTSVSASFPLGPGSAWSVDGMVASQLATRAVAPASLGPGEGPALALDVVVPRNGYRDDALTRMRVENLGTAPPTELAELRLWRDGGDGQLGGDDLDLGPLAPIPGGWESGVLSQPLAGPGARLFVAVTTAATLTDSATVRLAIPIGGLGVASGNDGPRDRGVENPDALLLTDRALLASLTAQPAAVTLGQTITVRLTVRNRSGEAVDAVTPSALAITGSAGLAIASGPIPASATIGPGGQQVFTWTVNANAAGEARFGASASGVGAVSGNPEDALPVASGLVRVFDQAEPFPWSASNAMPLSVNRGQTNVVPLFVTFGDGAAGAPSVRITALRLRLESGSGAGIVPADLLSRIAVRVGATTHVERTTLETSGSEVDLTLAAPIVVNGGGPLSAAIALDVAAGTVEPNFRVVVPDSSYLVAENAATGGPVTMRLAGQSYPVATGLARVVEEATELDVAAVAGAPVAAGQGQPGVPLATLRLTNPGVTGVTSDVRVSAFAVMLRDGAGAAIAAPAGVIERLQVRVGPQLLADRPVTASEDSVVDLALSPLLAVPVNSPLDLLVTADLAPAATLGTFRLEVGDTARFDARDPNSGDRVAVIYAAPPLRGAPVTVQAPAESLAARGVPRMPPTVAVGTSGVLALELPLRHPGAPGQAPVRLDSLSIRTVDESRNPLPPGAYVERLHLWWRGAEVATLSDPPATGGAMGIGIAGVTLAPGETDTLALVLDFEAAAPPTSFELILNASGLLASDANTASPVLIVPETGFEFPALSGLTRFAAPARTLIAGLVDGMPASLAADGAEVVAGRISLLNDAIPGSGDVTVDSFTVRAADAVRSEIPIGSVASAVALYVGGALWGQAVVQPGDGVAALTGTALAIAPQSPMELELRFVARAGSPAPGLRLGFAAADVGVVQPANPLLAIAVQAPPGQGFPLWTELGNFTVASLEASYANFPNPFAAGREATRFAYYLPGAGRVTLRLWTPRGERVASLLEDAARGAGLHQDDAWDGRNGRGEVVANGVYVAELVVRLDGGESRRLLRKVAVVR
jgi:hypothetical protein